MGVKFECFQRLIAKILEQEDLVEFRTFRYRSYNFIVLHREIIFRKPEKKSDGGKRQEFNDLRGTMRWERQKGS